MTAPQTRAEIIGKYGCLAMCYLYCVGIIPDNPASYILSVSKAMDKKLLDDNCTVLDATKYLEYFTGKKFKIQKKEINSISDIKEPTPVRYDHNGFGHWVVIQDGAIVFNSIEKSVCVEKGKPTTARIITLA